MKVLLFGITRDIAGQSEIEISGSHSSPTSVLDLKKRLTAKFPEFAQLSSLTVAVNNEYAHDNAILNNTDEIALIPPVSGG